MITIQQIKDELDIHFKRIDMILPEVKSYLPFENDDFEDIEKIKAIDSFIYRFTKIQDKMGDKFFPAILRELEEYKNSMALIDVLHKLERLELLENSDDWIDYRRLRNSLTHEYPNNSEEVLEAINLSIEVYQKIKIIYTNMLNRVNL
ncbi:hypothetical protein MNB_SV-9-1431 [hydrothermal vent metagenome]|uniref:Toxin-antitoxin system antitoxin subunit n=1 Tax=hydrothermal vent metagenome TaxID=652676 RepID=A0A1W1C5X4_9ZZZZ